MTEYQTPEFHPAFEEYCEAIWELKEDDVDVIQARIAERLAVSRPAVSEMIKRMAGEGFVALDGTTINLTDVPPDKLLPPDGVYAVRVQWRGGRAEGMMNQGPKPTFQDGRRSLEAHLFDFDGDLYGEWVRVEWVARLRDVTRFALRRSPPHDAIGWATAADRPARPAVADICRFCGFGSASRSSTPLSAFPYLAEKPPVVKLIPLVMNGSTAPRKPPVGVSYRYG